MINLSKQEQEIFSKIVGSPLYYCADCDLELTYISEHNSDHSISESKIYNEKALKQAIHEAFEAGKQDISETVLKAIENNKDIQLDMSIRLNEREKQTALEIQHIINVEFEKWRDLDEAYGYTLVDMIKAKIDEKYDNKR